MFPVQKQEGQRGIGMGYEGFLRNFEAICQEHLREKRARAFAFVFYNPSDNVVRRALKEADGFRLLHEKTGEDITLFYLHDGALDARWRKFNRTFMKELGVQHQAVVPCIVFFRLNGKVKEDVWIYRMDEQSSDPVLLVTEMQNYVDDAIKRMNAGGDFSALSGLGKAIGPVMTFVKIGELLMKLKGSL